VAGKKKAGDEEMNSTLDTVKPIDAGEHRMLYWPKTVGYFNTQWGLTFATYQVPTRWQRLWYKFLLGWTWRKAE
jgi:hypothetical protein